MLVAGGGEDFFGFGANVEILSPPSQRLCPHRIASLPEEEERQPNVEGLTGKHRLKRRFKGRLKRHQTTS